MKVSREQAADNRQRILDAAARLFRESGFDGVGIDGIMRDAGLTHGGFYGHFASKEDLAAQACARSLGRSERRWAALADSNPDGALADIVRGYLSRRHRDDPGAGCAISALAGDIARHRGPVRRAFTDSLRAHVDTLTRLVRGRSKAARRETALAAMAGLAGALMLARAVDDEAFSDEIMDAAVAIFGGTSADTAASDRGTTGDA